MDQELMPDAPLLPIGLFHSVRLRSALYCLVPPFIGHITLDFGLARVRVLVEHDRTPPNITEHRNTVLGSDNASLDSGAPIGPIHYSTILSFD